MRAKPPRVFLLELLADRYDINIAAMYRRVDAELEGEEDYLVCGLLDLCAELLKGGDAEVEKWQLARTREHKWTVEKVWLAASLVADVRALGYGLNEACRIVQAKQVKQLPELKGANSLRDTLKREHRAGTFERLPPLQVRSPADARAALAQRGFDVSLEALPPGNLPPRTGRLVPWWGSWDAAEDATE